MPTPNATPDPEPDRNKAVTVSVEWFHSGLAYRFGAYPEHRDSDVPKELREAADEWDKYRHWKCRKGRPLLLTVKQGDFCSFGDAVVHVIYRTLGIKYLKIDSLHYEIVP